MFEHIANLLEGYFQATRLLRLTTPLGAPAWRFDIADATIYPLRSLATQYQESDLAFAERLMSEEGLFYYFEHEGDAGSPSLGQHRMVIADHNGAFQSNAQRSVRYTRPGAVMKEDSIDLWRCELRLQTNAINLTPAKGGKKII